METNIIIKRTCLHCKEEKDLTLFAVSYKKKDKRRITFTCKTCRNKKRKDATLNFFNECLVGKSCMDCGTDNILVLEFDHRNPEEKLTEVSRLAQWRAGKPRILAEIAKCDIVCSNCHTIRTMKRGNFSRYKFAVERGLIKE